MRCRTSPRREAGLAWSDSRVMSYEEICRRAAQTERDVVVCNFFIAPERNSVDGLLRAIPTFASSRMGP